MVLPDGRDGTLLSSKKTLRVREPSLAPEDSTGRQVLLSGIQSTA